MQAGLLSREIYCFGVPTPSYKAEGNIAGGVFASRRRTPRGRRTCACTESPCARTGRSHDHPPCGDGRGGSCGEGRGRNPVMHDRGKSDGPVVPAKPPNNARAAAAEVVEGRGPAEGNAASETRPGRSAGHERVKWAGSRAPGGAEGQGCAVHRAPASRDVDRLRAAYRAIRPKAAPGVDGVTWQDYGQDLEENLRDLHARVHRGATGRSRLGGCTSRRPTGGSGRSGSPRWRTRSSSGRWSRC